MAKGNETTTKFKVDISELKKSMQEARKQVAYANSEFKATASTMDDWSKSSDGIGAKLKQLNSNLKSQEAVLAEYEKTLEEVKKEYGENSAQAVEYATKLNNQQAVVNKIRKEIAGYEESLEQVSKAEKIASKTGKDVADVLDEMANESEEAGEGFTTLKGAVATFTGNVMTSLVSGLKDAVVNLMSLSDETREYRDQMNKLNSAGTEAGYGVDYVKDKYKDLYGVLADETATATTVSNFMAMNAEQETLDSLLNSSIGIWAKYGDSIPLDGLAESINETSRVSQVTGNLADALNWAGINEDDFNTKLQACTSEQERQKLIADTLEKTYGGLSKSYQDSNSSVIEANKANADYTQTLADMGAEIEPVTTSLKAGFTGLLQELLKLVGDVDMEAFTAKIEEGFGVLKDEVLPAVKEGLGWIINNKEMVISGLMGIAGAFIAMKVVDFVNNLKIMVATIKSWELVTKLQTAAQWALNAAQNANPIGLVITAIGLLVVAFVTLWKKSDSFRSFWINLWTNIKDTVSTGIKAVTTFFKNLISWVKKNWQSLLLMLVNPFAGLFKYFYDNNSKFKEFVDNAIKYIKQLPSKVWTWLVNTITKITEWRNQMIQKAGEIALSFVNKFITFFSQIASKVWTWLTNVISKIVQWRINLINKALEAGKGFVTTLVNALSGLPNKMKEIGSNIVQGIWNGISSGWGWLKDQVSSLANSLYESAKKALGINSPSKVFADEVGKWIPAGIAVGIDKNAKTALNSVRDLAINTLGSARDGLQTTSSTGFGGGAITGGVVNNFYQTINSPKQLSRLDIYRQSKNLLGYAGGGF